MDVPEYDEAREVMVAHDKWVSAAAEAVAAALPKVRVEEAALAHSPDRTGNMLTFTKGLIVESEKARRGEEWDYETVVIRLAAALYQLGELQDALKTPVEGNRRKGVTGQSYSEDIR
jgi:hypothetical protein